MARLRASRGLLDPPAPARWTLIGLAVAFTLPMTTGLIGRALSSHGLWFTDYRAVLCGAQAAAAAEPLYDAAGASCAPQAAAFVYGPWIARGAGGLLKILGEGAFTGLYVAVFAAAVLVMLWIANLRAATPGDQRLRIAFLGFLPGGAVCNGNIAVILHAAIMLAALTLERAPWLFVLTVAAAGNVKPVLLSYLAVLVLAQRSWGWRIGAVAAGLALGLTPTLLFMANGGEQAAVWWRLLSHFVYEVSAGAGLFGWLAAIGVSAGGAFGLGLAAAWAGAFTLACLAVAERRRLSGVQRIWVGLACGVLVNPRLMSQDLFLLGPGVLVVLEAFAHRSPRVVAIGKRVLWGLCILVALGALTGLRDETARVATLMICTGLLGLAVMSFRNSTLER